MSVGSVESEDSDALGDALGAVLAPEPDEWWLVGCCDGCDVDEGVGELVVGVAVGCGAGLAPGVDRALLPFHEKATYPPSGTCSEAAPLEAYDQLPVLPSDHHRPQ